MNQKIKASPLTENEHVMELMSILKANGKDTAAIAAMIGCIGTMEDQLNQAAAELQSVMRELDAMREERSHPLRSALTKAARSMERSISDTRAQLESLKARVIEGCKQAVAAFKQQGITALNGIAKFFKVKPALQMLRGNLKNDIRRNQAAIARIKAISTEYHKAGRAIRNFGRALRGRKPIAGVKPNGKLAALLAAPFQAEIKHLTSARREAEKAIAALTRLEKTAPALTASRKDDKQSTIENMRRLKAKIEHDRAAAPVPQKSKRREEPGL